ncbi:cell division protein FtsQ/DivIB [Teredinibacter haidensis]|uniref:cell division protein FtsQ/DivIB n=1 Tax=Teredinibacter haidensis TaxID=2731755 RepID=UPI000948A651|nr:cell division protein FtsQ/DivIB [Teredinibacter haidensis]
MAPVKKHNSKGERVYGSKRKRSDGRVKSKGAVKKRKNMSVFFSAVRWGLWLKGMAVCGAFYLLAVYVDWWSLSNKAQALVNKPIANVVVKGEFTCLEKGTVQRMVVDHINGNFVGINLAELRSSLEKNAWVQSASVQRLWPDGLQIDVREQRPIARWGNSSFINHEGAVIGIGRNDQLVHLPQLSGPMEQSRQITRTYLDMTEMLSSHGMALVGIHVDPTLSWEVKLTSGVEIVFGQYEVLTKMRNFLLVYDTKLKADIQEVSRVDMRYESGMAVAWRDQVLASVKADH